MDQVIVQYNIESLILHQISISLWELNNILQSSLLRFKDIGGDKIALKRSSKWKKPNVINGYIIL